MAPLIRIMRALYCEPWLIQPEMHLRLCELAEAHATGAAHDPEGIVAKFARENAQTDERNTVQVIDDVAVINAGGVIGHKFSAFLNSSGVTSIDVFERLINEAAADTSIRAIMLDIDSPGGTVTGVPEAADAVANASKQKSVVAFTSGLMASAAYWISAPADAIFATESAEIGSIGVYAAFLDRTRELEMKGQSVELFKRGKFKAMGIAGLPLTEEQRELIQEGIDDIHEWFTGAVRSNRTVDASALEGQTFRAEKAAAVGLVDRVGSFADAIDFAKSSRS